MQFLRFASSILVSSILAALILAGVAWSTAGASSHESAGSVYTMSNSADGNEVLVYRRRADGTLEHSKNVATGGRGSGGALGNQGGLIVSKDNLWLVTVNAGSNDVSVFAIRESGLELTDRERSDGAQPVSVTMQGDVIYVLNAGSDSVSGFALSRHGRLHKLHGSRRALSDKGTGPAQAEFSPDGRTLLVTEKNTNSLTSFPVFYGSILGRGQTIPASGRTPFGFAYGRRNQVFVSQAEAGEAGLSTVAAYSLNRISNVMALGSPQPTMQTAACWVAITLDHRYAYATNTGSDSVSGFRLTVDGGLEPLGSNSVVATVASGGAPIDMGITEDNRFLYVLNGGTRSLDGFLIGDDGELSAAGSVSGLPAAVNGLAVR